MSDKLGINNEMAQLDQKNRQFFDELNDVERKKFSTYLMMKYSANVEGSADLQEWYLRASNERVNKNFFDINGHAKLQWLLCTSVSPGLGRQRHFWLNSKKKDGPSNTKIVKFIVKHHPWIKQDEAELLSHINTIDDMKKYAKAMGMSDEEIKKELT
jgi:hypothetical protein